MGFVLMVICMLAACGNGNSDRNTGLRFEISFSRNVCSDPLDGRMLLMISADDSREPRFQISNGPDSQLIFGIDVNGLEPETEAVIDSGVFGYPLSSLTEIPEGEYWVQALINRYETFHLADGRVLKLPPDKGEGQKWNLKPGNLYSVSRKIHIHPDSNEMIPIVLDQEIPPIPEPEDTKYIKHVKIQSKLLSEFWGRPTYLGAHVLLPEGFEDHPEARYPLCVFHGHFPHDFGGFRETPPDPDLEPDYSARFDIHGYNRIVQQQAYDFYCYWTAPDTPRMLIIKIQHPTPYFDDSYAVNSANMGPYGDAINYELIPYIEKRFRGIGEGWARFLYGGSTGGWEALAVQVFYPDMYNGCFAACPDPIDFRAYTLINIYEDKNAYYFDSDWKQTPRPRSRTTLGEVTCTLQEVQYKEAVLGSKGRSGGQRDVWLTLFGPAGEDGYPKHLWDKMTGEIDPETAEYWCENFDLRHIMERDWESLGPKLKGKIHIYVGDMDNSYLNNAVYLMEDFLESTTNPYYDGEVDYGDGAGHCWNGDHTRPNAISRLRYNQMYVPKIMQRIRESAPPGADLTSWRY
ncbi:MAG: alpha/beta hydrolase-fold protein [Candidatus Aminicenantaceae bacterium]